MRRPRPLLSRRPESRAAVRAAAPPTAIALKQACVSGTCRSGELADAVHETQPAVAESLKPPGDSGGSGELLGAAQEEIREFAIGG